MNYELNITISGESADKLLALGVDNLVNEVFIKSGVSPPDIESIEFYEKLSPCEQIVKMCEGVDISKPIVSYRKNQNNSTE